DANEVFKYTIATNTWSKLTTTGTKPTATLGGVYALDESRNKLVGWVGCDNMSGSCTPVVSQTYMLDLSTLVWSLGPGPSDPHPPNSVMGLLGINYDAYRHRILVMVQNTAPDGGTQVWWYDDDDVADDLVSWWPGEGTAADVVGTSNGTLMGNASFGSGVVGAAFSFDGAGDW